MKILLITQYHKIDLDVVDTISFRPMQLMIILEYRDEDLTIHFDSRSDCFEFMKRILQAIRDPDEDSEVIQVDLRDIWAFFECYETARLIHYANLLTHKN